MKALPLEVRLGFAARLRTAMNEAGFHGEHGVRKFADAHSFPRQQVYDWLRGQIPNAMEALRLAQTLAVNPEWLLLDEGEMTRPTIAPGLRKLLVLLALGAACLGLPSQTAGHVNRITDMPLDNLPLIRSWRRRTWAPA